MNYTDLQKKAHGTLLLSNNAFAPSWFDDTPACMLCEKRFSTLTRRHHCRACGYCVCSGCASTYVTLPRTNKRVRVCNKCVGEMNLGKSSDQITDEDIDLMFDPKTMSKSNTKQPSQTEIQINPQEVPVTNPNSPQTSQLLGIVDVPAWTYLVKPFTSLGDQIRIGRVALRIVKISNLPLPSANPFENLIIEPSVRVGSHIVHAPAVDAGLCGMRTRVNADIGCDMLLDINSSQQQLRIQLAASTVPSSNKKDKKAAEKAEKASALISSHSSTPLGYSCVDIHALYRGKGQTRLTLNLDLEGVHGAESNVRNDASLRPQVTVEVQYMYNPVGHFWSQFTHPDATTSTTSTNTSTMPPRNAHAPSNTADDTEWHRPIAFATFARDFLLLLYHLAPLTACLDIIQPVVAWESPILSCSLVGASLIAIFFMPSLFLLHLHVLLIRAIVSSYMAQRSSKDTNTTNTTVPAMRAQVEQLCTLVPDALSPPISASAADIGGAVTAAQANTDLLLSDLFQDILEHMLPLTGIGSLQQVDHALSRATHYLSAATDLISWRNPVLTGALLVLASCSLLLTLLGQQTLVWIALGVALLTWNTTIVHILCVLVRLVWSRSEQ